MRIRVLGSGTLVPDPGRRSAGHLVEAADQRLLLDCGSGTLHSPGAIDSVWQALDHVLLSHFHTDHIGDLAPLLFALKHVPDPPREAPLTILGPRGVKGRLERLAAAFGDFVLDPGFPVRVREIHGGGAEELGQGVIVQARATVHTDESLAYRVTAPGGSLGYTGDTGPSDDLGAFFQGVDVLLAECSHTDPPRFDNHLTPGGVARLAAVARPRLVVTVHHYPEIDPSRIPDLVASQGYTGSVMGGRDGLTLLVGPEEVEVQEIRC